jgi:ribosome maturation factor RimP
MQGGINMIDNKKIEELVMPYLEEHNLSLYEILWVKEFGYNVLRVSVDQKGGINSDTLALVNVYLSSKLDNYEDELPQNYMLEVCSPGAEKTLRNKDEVIESVGLKVNVKMPDMVYEGTLIDFTDNILTIEYNLKGRKQKVTLDYDQVKKIRLAV